MRFANDNLKKILKLSVPLAATQLSLHFMGFVDVVVAGRINETILGAVGLGTTVFFTCGLLGLGIALALDPVISQAIGSGDEKKAHHALWQGHYAAGFNAILLTALTWGVAYGLRFTGMEEGLYENALIYVEARLPALSFFLFAMNLKSYLQSHHLTRPILVSAIVANVVNFVGDVWLCGAVLPDNWQWLVPPGALSLDAWGVAAASAVAGFVQMAWLIRPTKKVSQGTQRPQVDLPTIKRLYRLGMPISAQLLLEIGSFSIVLLLMARHSTTAAAHQVASNNSLSQFQGIWRIGSGSLSGPAHRQRHGRKWLGGFLDHRDFDVCLQSGCAFETISRVLTNQEVSLPCCSLVFIAMPKWAMGCKPRAPACCAAWVSPSSPLCQHHWPLGGVAHRTHSYLRARHRHPGLWWGLAGLGTVALIYLVTHRAQHRPVGIFGLARPWLTRCILRSRFGHFRPSPARRYSLRHWQLGRHRRWQCWGSWLGCAILDQNGDSHLLSPGRWDFFSSSTFKRSTPHATKEYPLKGLINYSQHQYLNHTTNRPLPN